MFGAGGLGEKLLFVLVILGFLTVFSFMRGRNPKKVRADTVRTLLSETRINTILVDTFDRQPVQRRFEVTGWHMYRKKLVFLDAQVRKDLDETFSIATDFNTRLKVAKKAKSTERVPVDIEALKAVLPKAKQGLEDWLLANVGSIDTMERPGMLDGLFGGGGRF